VSRRVLVDTSVWVDHLRRGSGELARLLEDGSVLGHPFVVGELACGSLARRDEILGLLQQLPQPPLVGHEEALRFVERRRLAGSGVGWVDVHLLASAVLGDCRLWTLDRALGRAAARVGIA
jgi:predicted nucleic acid-binding protein